MSDLPTLGRPTSSVPGPALGNGTPPDLNGLRVLLVEDEPDSRVLLAKALRAYRAAVTTAASAAEAETALALSQHDVIVSDIGLPDRDGYEFLRGLRSREAAGATPVRPIPAVALTGYAGAEERRRAHEAGFQGHLAKPVTLTELAAVIGRLGRRQ